jgi:hypothetical protein
MMKNSRREILTRWLKANSLLALGFSTGWLEDFVADKKSSPVLLMEKRRLWHSDNQFNELFVSNYLESKEFRMRAQMDYLPAQFWRNHSDNVKKACASDKLLLRAKVCREELGLIEVVNIWRSEKDQLDFHRLSGGPFFLSELKKMGFRMQVEVHDIRLSSLQAVLLAELSRYPNRLEHTSDSIKSFIA